MVIFISVGEEVNGLVYVVFGVLDLKIAFIMWLGGWVLVGIGISFRVVIVIRFLF